MMNNEKCVLCKRPMGNSAQTWKRNGVEEPCHDICYRIWSFGWEAGVNDRAEQVSKK